MRARHALLAVGLLVAVVAADAGNRLQTRTFRQGWQPGNALDNGATVAFDLDARDISLMTNDGANVISSWKDHRTQLALTATTTARPTWSPTSFNGNPGMTCDGTANAPTTTTLTALPTGSTTGSIIVLASSTGANASNQYMLSYGGTSASRERKVRLNGSGVPAVFNGTTATNDATTITGIHIIEGDWSGTSQLGFIDGVAFTGNPGTVATLNTDTLRLRVCSDNAVAASLFWAGIFSRGFIISGVVSTADMQRFAGYLGWQANLRGAPLPASSPYKGAPP